MTRPQTAALAALALAAWLLWGLADGRQLIAGALAGGLLYLNAALGALLLVCMHQSSGGAWGNALGLELRSVAACLPLAAVPLTLALVMGYPVLQQGAAEAASGTRAAYLGAVPLALRTAAWLTLWSVLALLAAARLGGDRRVPALGAIGLLVILPSLMLFAVDWLAALEPGWYSSSIGLVLAGAQLLPAFAVALLAGAHQLDAPVRRDVARLLVGALLFFAYLAFMEFLIIWSGHLPHEITWYARRNDGGWQGLLIGSALCLTIAAVALPFRAVRDSSLGLQTAALLVLVGHGGWLLWMVLPAVGGGAWPGALLGVVGWMALLWLGSGLLRQRIASGRTATRGARS